MEFDQPGECGSRVRRGVDDGLAAFHQSGAHPDQQFDQQCLFVGEVPVDGRSADSGRGADVLQADGEEAAFGDQLLGGAQQLRATIGFLPVAGLDGPSRTPLDDLS